MYRSQVLEKIRIDIAAAKVTETTSPLEAFQNKTLRSIIKFQHELLLAITVKNLSKFNTNFRKLSNEKIEKQIDLFFSKDINFRNQLIGSIIGFFTLDEYVTYLKIEKDSNKRILQICKERILTHLQELKK